MSAAPVATRSEGPTADTRDDDGADDDDSAGGRAEVDGGEGVEERSGGCDSEGGTSAILPPSDSSPPGIATRASRSGKVDGAVAPACRAESERDLY